MRNLTWLLTRNQFRASVYLKRYTPKSSNPLDVTKVKDVLRLVDMSLAVLLMLVLNFPKDGWSIQLQTVWVCNQQQTQSLQLFKQSMARAETIIETLMFHQVRGLFSPFQRPNTPFSYP